LPFNIVLYQPEIPQNTGNIARTCAVTGARLHIIKPMGFSVDDRYLRRAGLDYWDKLDLTYYENLDDFFTKTSGAKLYFSTTKAQQNYCDVTFRDGDFIMFGRESAGITDEVDGIRLDDLSYINMDYGGRLTARIAYNADYSWELTKLTQTLAREEIQSNMTGTIDLRLKSEEVFIIPGER